MLLITPAEVIRMAFTPREIINPESVRTLKIDIAQEHFIRPRVGDDMFEEMTDGLHTEFVEEYIKPALAQFVRYGVITEMAVKMDNNGALVYSSSSGSKETQANKTAVATVNQTQTNETTQVDAEQGTAKKELTREEYGDSYSMHTFVKTNTMESDEDTKKVDTTDNLSDRGFDEHSTSKTSESQSSKTDETTDEKTATEQQNDNSKNEHLRAATMLELKMLTTRALSDGNILLAKAVRHVERHPEIYPAYVPSKFSSHIFY